MAKEDVDITRIPGFMRLKGWHNGARLMERWMGLPANDRPASGTPDIETVVMRTWVLTFERAKKVYDQILRERIWSNEAARKELVKILKRQGKLTAQKTPFGNLRRRVPEIDRDYVNFRTVGSVWDSLDDMFAALGKFTFRVAVAGYTDPIIPPPPPSKDGGAKPDAGPPPAPKEWNVVIEQAGIYCVDSYDFNGDQSLGYWNFEKGDVGKTPMSGDEVTNRHYRDWRQRTGRGGDFMVFSTLETQALLPPDSFRTS
jgi:hypothetical protein